MEERKTPSVIVAGSLIMDLVVRVPHHPSVGETIVGHDFSTFPGGKGANQAVAAARAGAPVQMLGQRGADEFGEEMIEFLKAAKVDTAHVKMDPNAATGVGHVSVADDGSNAIIIIPGANGFLSPEIVQNIEMSAADVLVAQLEIPFETIEGFFAAGRKVGARTILNAAPASGGADRLVKLTDILVVNEVELAHFAGRNVDIRNKAEIRSAAESLKAFKEQSVIVTLGDAGLVGITAEKVIEVAAHKVMAVDTTGAGDCFTGALAAHLCEGASLEQALHFANAAACLSVQTAGAGPSMPTRTAIDRQCSQMPVRR